MRLSFRSFPKNWILDEAWTSLLLDIRYFSHIWVSGPISGFDCCCNFQSSKWNLIKSWNLSHCIPGPNNEQICLLSVIGEVHELHHGLRTPRERFFSKIRNFWAWADKLGWHFKRHLGYFWPNYKHYFGTESPLTMGKCSWFTFLQKNSFLGLEHF